MEARITKEEIIKDLKPLYNEAEEKNLWFYSNYQDMWISPNELRQKQSEDRFLWGAVNWELRDPHEKVEDMEDHIKYLRKSIVDFKDRISKSMDNSEN